MGREVAVSAMEYPEWKERLAALERTRGDIVARLALCESNRDRLATNYDELLVRSVLTGRDLDESLAVRWERALREYGRLRTRLNAALADVRAKITAHECERPLESAKTFGRCFLQAARDHLPREVYDRIHAAAKAAQAQILSRTATT